MTQKTIITWVTALVNLVTSWRPNTSIESDIQDGIMLLGTASQLGAAPTVTQALINDASKAEAFVADLNNNQVATLPEVMVGGKKVVVFCAYADAPVLQTLGL